MSNEIHPTHVLKQTSGPLTACAWSTNHRIAVAQLCGTDNRPTVEILDFNAQVELNSKPKLVAECVGHSGRIVHARFTRNGNHLATCGSDDGSAKIWETGTGAKIKSLKKQIGPNGAVNGCDWSPDGRKVVTCSDDKICRIWDETGKTIRILSGHTQVINGVVWSPDGKRILTCSDDNLLKVYDSEAGDKLQTLRGHSDRVTDCDWSPDSQCVVSVSLDGLIIIWNWRNSEQLQTLSDAAFPSLVQSKWSPDGRFLAVADNKGAIIVWDILSKSMVRTLVGHTSKVNSLVWSPDHSLRILSAAEDGQLFVWDANLPQTISSEKNSMLVEELQDKEDLSQMRIMSSSAPISSEEEKKEMSLPTHDSSEIIAVVANSSLRAVKTKPKVAVVDVDDTEPIRMDTIFKLDNVQTRERVHSTPELEQEIENLAEEQRENTSQMQNLVEEIEYFAADLVQKGLEVAELRRKLNIYEDAAKSFVLALVKVLTGLLVAQFIQDLFFNLLGFITVYPAIVSILYFGSQQADGWETIQIYFQEILLISLMKKPTPFLASFMASIILSAFNEAYFTHFVVLSLVLFISVMLEVKDSENLCWLTARLLSVKQLKEKV